MPKNGKSKTESIKDYEVIINLYKAGVKVQDILAATGLSRTKVQDTCKVYRHALDHDFDFIFDCLYGKKAYSHVLKAKTALRITGLEKEFDEYLLERNGDTPKEDPAGSRREDSSDQKFKSITWEEISILLLFEFDRRDLRKWLQSGGKDSCGRKLAAMKVILDRCLALFDAEAAEQFNNYVSFLESKFANHVLVWEDCEQ